MKNIYCIVGPSGCGKTTLTEALAEKYGYKVIESYTTRPPRYEGEKGHIFVSPEEFKALGEMCAYTKFDGHEYGVTPDLIERNDLYVIDPAGIEYLRQKYNGEKGVKVIGITAPVDILIERMIVRGDSEDKIIKRLANDAEAFKHLDYITDAFVESDRPIEELCESVKYRIDNFEEREKHEFSLLNEFGKVVEDGKQFYSYNEAYSALLKSETYASGLPDGWKLRDDTKLAEERYLKEIKRLKPSFKSSMIKIQMSGISHSEGHTAVPFRYKGKDYFYRSSPSDEWIQEVKRDLPSLTGEQVLKNKINFLYKQMEKIDMKLATEYETGETDWSAQLEYSLVRMKTTISYLEKAVEYIKQKSVISSLDKKIEKAANKQKKSDQHVKREAEPSL